MALEAIATAYRADNRYDDAGVCRIVHSLAHQSDDLPTEDAALARVLLWHAPANDFVAWPGKS